MNDMNVIYGINGPVVTVKESHSFSMMETEIKALGISPGDLAGMTGTETYLCEDGTLYGTNDLSGEVELRDRAWSEKGVRQAVELWKGYYSSIGTEAFALLTDEGRVKIR